MKKFIIMCMALLFVAGVFADVIIGTGTATGRYPLNDYYVYSRSQCIYSAAEIGVPAGGTITALKWYRNDTGADPNAIGTTEIWLTETAATTLSTWQPEGTLVATISNIDLGSGGNWLNVPITAFSYTGSNLMVTVRTQNAPYTSPHSYWRYTSTATYMSLLGNSDSENPPSVSTSYYRPNITLVGITQATPPGICSLVFPTPTGVTGVTGMPTLQWAAGTGTPTQYDIYFGETLPAEGSPTVSNHLTTSWAPGTLNWNTTYSWKIVPENAYGAPAFGDCPTWTFTTMTDPTIYLPPEYTQDFGTTGAAFPPTNWNKYSGALANPTVLGAPGTGGWYQRNWRNVSADPVNFAAVINIYSTVNGWLISPPISVPGNDYELKFDLALTDYYNSNPITSDPAGTTGVDDVFAVLIGDGTSWTPANVVRQWDNAGSPFVYNNINYLGESVTIPLGAAGTKYVAFYGISTASNADNDLFVDNVILRQQPAAPIFSVTPTSHDYGTVQVSSTTPQNFVIANNGGGSLGISSIAVTTGSEYYAITYDQGNTPLTGGQTRSFTVTYTAPATEGGPYAGVVTITDDRAVTTINLSGSSFDPSIQYADLPYTTSFEDAWVGTPPAPAIGWSVVNANADSYTWRRGATYIPANTGTVFAQGMGCTNDWMITPPITTGVPVRLKWYDRVESATYPNSYKVLLSTTDNQPASFTTELADITCNWLTWTEHTLTFNNTSGTAYIAFYQYASPSSAWDFGIDDLTLEELPGGPPLPPTLTYPVALTGLPQTGFDLTWEPDPLSGPVDYYNVYFWTDEQSIGDGPIWSTIATSLDPTNPPLDPLGDPQTPIVFDYLDRYNWTVEAYADAYPTQAAWPTESWFEIQDDPRITIPYTQDFGTTLTWPQNWTQSFTAGGSNRWTVTATNNAGGVADEMTLTWASGTFISRLITPPIDTDGIPMFQVKFNQMYDGYGTGITAKLQYSHDLVTWYDTSWSIVGTSATVGPNIGNAVISGLSEPVTYVAWALDGNHYQVDYWYVDNVVLQVPPNHDVGVVSWDYPREVVPEGTVVTPVATVGNFGINAESFTVTCTIGTYTNTQSVTGLAFGATQQVTFPSFTPALWSAENVIVNTTLATDEASDNDTLYSALICLDLDTPALANNAQTGQFVQFNLSDPGTLNPLPNTYTGTYFMSGGDWMNGQWMGVEYDDGTLVTDNYYEIDPLTGTYLPSLGEPGQAFMGIAYDDTNAILYGVTGTSGYLYTMDPLTGVAAVGDSLWFDLGVDGQWSLANIGGLMIDIAYDNFTETLYGIDLGNDCLWIIDPATYELTFVGYFGVDLNYAQDAAFDQDNGLLFLCGYSATGALYWIDTQFGGAYQVGLLGTLGYELDGFAIPYGILTIPEPTVATTGQISWPAVEGAVHYQVLKSSDPYGTYAPYATVYGTSWTDLLFSEGKAFYQIVAVGGVRSDNRQEVRFNQPLRKAGQLGLNKRVNTGIAW